MSGLTRAVFSAARTKRRRYLWCAWWTGEPTVDPFRAPDVWGGGARTEEEAKVLAEKAAGMPLQQIDAHWAAAFKRQRAGLPPFVKRETRMVETPGVRPVDPRSVLGVSPDASAEEVKGAFRRKALEAHPDRGGSAEAFITLKRAYDAIVARRARSKASRARR